MPVFVLSTFRNNIENDLIQSEGREVRSPHLTNEPYFVTTEEWMQLQKDATEATNEIIEFERLVANGEDLKIYDNEIKKYCTDDRWKGK